MHTFIAATLLTVAAPTFATTTEPPQVAENRDAIVVAMPQESDPIEVVLFTDNAGNEARIVAAKF